MPPTAAATPLSGRTCGAWILAAALLLTPTARAEAPPSPRQITALEPEARASLDFGAPLEDRPWLGARPSLPDGLPAIGRAPGHARIIFAFGHGHIGMSTGPATAEAVADLLTDRAPAFDLAAFSPARFG